MRHCREKGSNMGKTTQKMAQFFFFFYKKVIGVSLGVPEVGAGGGRYFGKKNLSTKNLIFRHHNVAILSKLHRFN